FSSRRRHTRSKRDWSSDVCSSDLGLLVGVLLAAAGLFVPFPGAVAVLLNLGMLLGLVFAVGAAVLVIVHEEGTFLSAVLGVAACVLVALAVPAAAVRAVRGLSSSLLVLLAALVVQAGAVAAIVGVLGSGGAPWRALRRGVAAAGMVSAVLIAVAALALLFEDLAGVSPPQPPPSAVLITALVALVLGSVAGGVLDTV